MTEPTYQVGDVIGLPPEPPLGTTIQAQDISGVFRLIRREEGWYLLDVNSRVFPWGTVAELWFPVIVTGVGGLVRCSGCGRWIAKSTMMCDACIDKGL